MAELMRPVISDPWLHEIPTDPVLLKDRLKAIEIKLDEINSKRDEALRAFEESLAAIDEKQTERQKDILRSRLEVEKDAFLDMCEWSTGSLIAIQQRILMYHGENVA